MCGLFGYSAYGKNEKTGYFNDLINALAISSADRGTDATGIAYLLDKKIEIQKDSKAAYDLRLDVPDGTCAVLGHTRKSTQGSEKRNYNNHPFPGKTDKASFALAHNGIISNDRALRNSLKLPKTKVETDSYIAVQLLEQAGILDMESLKKMAEAIQGSFSFTVLDDQDTLFIVKGDSPISILHFKELKLYVYASTDKILWKALVNSPLFEKLKSGICNNQCIDEFRLNAGQILKISSDGKLDYGSFKYSVPFGFEYDWANCGLKKNSSPEEEDEYLDELRQLSGQMGYSDNLIDRLLEEGFTALEIEEYLYDPDMFQSAYTVMHTNER
jgi:Glucosamine 6-phosphate synthetase, contains amidotransferase and phosphosugar isomerase domains